MFLFCFQTHDWGFWKEGSLISFLMCFLNFLQPIQVGQALQLLQPNGHKSCQERRTRKLSQDRFLSGISESLRTSAETPTGEAQNAMIPEKTCLADTVVPHRKWWHRPTWGTGMRAAGPWPQGAKDVWNRCSTLSSPKVLGSWHTGFLPVPACCYNADLDREF